MSDTWKLCSFKWWKMICSPLISALERDEQFLAGVLRSAEKDPSLQVDQLQLQPVTGELSSDAHALTSVTKLRVHGRTGKNLKRFYKTLVVKRHPEQGMSQRNPAFCNETAVYASVLPALRQWVGSKDTGLNLLPFPACLHASTSVIVLEDLEGNGFSAAQRLKGLDLDHSIAAFQALGRFHAISISLKYHDRNVFESILNQVKEVVFVPNAAPVFGASLESALELAITSLKQCSEQVIFDAVQILQSLQGRSFRTLVSLVTPKEPLSVICHGDFWINNVMFSYRDQKVSDVALTDLQVVRYSSLATDILHFMYTSLEPGLSRDYSDNLLKVYHKSLSETMEKLMPSAPFVTLEEILDEVESHALYGLLMSFLVLPSISDNSKEIDDSSLCYCNRYSFTYSQRVKDIVLEFVEKGFI